MKKEDYTGNWKLVSSEFWLADGSVIYPMGRDATGLLMYSTGGYMSVQIMSSDRHSCTSCDRVEGIIEETKSAFEEYIAYFGTYEVNQEEGTILHRIQGCLNPKWVGLKQKRFLEIYGDRLTLRASGVRLGGQEMSGVLHWKRVD